MFLPSPRYCLKYVAKQVKDLVEKDLEKVRLEEKKVSKEHDDVEKKMKKLKATLYGKFGNSINLEE